MISQNLEFCFRTLRIPYKENEPWNSLAFLTRLSIVNKRENIFHIQGFTNISTEVVVEIKSNWRTGPEESKSVNKTSHLFSIWKMETLLIDQP